MDDEYDIEKLEEAARLLYSSITSEASEYPNSKDKLFTSQKDSWHLNACISSYDKIGPYTAGYLDAAKLLARIVIFSGRGMDTLVYPIIYLYRHYLEIELKSLIKCGIDVTGTSTDDKVKEILGSHNLMKLWNGFKPFFEKISGHNQDFGDVRKGMEAYISQIHQIDPESFAFRYDRSRDLKTRNLEGVEQINILHFCQTMEKLTDLLVGISYEFDVALSHVNDKRQEYSNY
jgi:hypothetical protein